jgi:hypothetical protein
MAISTKKRQGKARSDKINANAYNKAKASDHKIKTNPVSDVAGTALDSSINAKDQTTKSTRQEHSITDQEIIPPFYKSLYKFQNR